MMVPLTLTGEKKAGGGEQRSRFPPGLFSRRVTVRGRSVTLGPASFDRNPSDPLQIVWRRRLPAIAPASAYTHTKWMPRLYPTEKHQLLTNRALPHGWHCTDKQRARTNVKQPSGGKVDASRNSERALKKLLLCDHVVITHS
ncbi:hypothetical protein GJV14_11290 [Enterobacteriaceae bacterium RIT697]|nr:hypothetical protein [Enterobacteriaceae bacterium RIT697]